MKKTSILIVDDLAAQRSQFSSWLRHPDIQLYTASGSSEAIAIIQAHELDLALIDVVLEDGDGFGITSALTSQQPQCKVIAVSTRHRRVDEAWMQRMGASMFISKVGLSGEHLRSQIASLITFPDSGFL